MRGGLVPPFWRRILGELYYFTTFPGRQWYARRLAAAGKAPLSVLTFHRVANDQATPWTTPTIFFARTIRWLKRHCDLISLSELQKRMQSGSCGHPGVSISFDDGYEDNCRAALPILIEERIPCVYFVTTRAVLTGDAFEHDVRLGHRFAPNTVEQLRELSRLGIEIGAHTRTHLDLGRVVNRRQLIDEVVTAREELEAAVGQRIRYFAFPFGRPENLSVDAFHLTQVAGYDGVCSAYGGWNYPGDNPFHIRRRCVDGPPNRAKNWTLVDPLRERSLPRFTYPNPPQPSPSLAHE